MNPAPIAEHIRQFLADYLGEAIHLVSILPDRTSADIRSTWGRWFDTDVEAAVAWAVEENRTKNVYWSVNTVKAGYDDKPTKDAIVAAAFAHCDVDPPKDGSPWDRAAALASMQSASFVIDSGNGLQPLYRLDEETRDKDLVEDINRRLESALHGDACSNIDRVLRLPGTVNWPSAVKRARGRGVTMASIARPDSGATFSPAVLQAQYPPAAPKATRQRVDLPPYEILGLDELVPVAPGRLRSMVLSPRPDKRSEEVYAVACEMLTVGYSVAQIAGIILNPDLPISAHCFDPAQPSAERAAARAISSALAKQPNPEAAFGIPSIPPPPPPVKPVAPTSMRVGAHRGLVLSPDQEKDKNDHQTIEKWCERVGACFAYNEFTGEIVYNGREALHDRIEREVWLHMREMSLVKFPWNLFGDTVRNIAWRNRFHPVREYLDHVQSLWDGVPRLDGWMERYLGVARTPFSEAVAGIFLTAAVRRVRQPGCKFDEMVVLEGPQGSGKSTAFETLCPYDEWFTDNIHLGMPTKEVMEVTAGKWIIEAPELSKMDARDIEHIKAMLSRRRDKARMAFERSAIEVGRQYVIGGTTNADTYLRDPTGNRRFYPSKTGRIDLKGLAANRDQLWAEAAVREAAGASIQLPEALWADAAVEQAARVSEDTWQTKLEDMLGDKTGKVRGLALLDALRIQPEKHAALLPRIGHAMKAIGWENKLVRDGGKPIRYFVKGDPARTIIWGIAQQLEYEPTSLIAVN